MKMLRCGRKLTRLSAAAILASFASFSNAQPTSADAVTQDNIDIYVLVDESSSLSQDDIKLEREAVESILRLQDIKKRGIRVGLIPFSSGAGSPRKLERCELVPIDDGNDLVLAECAKKIKRQSNEQGNTDFASAFNSMADRIIQSGESDRFPVIILLTDGIYDPDGDQESTTEEKENLDKALARLKDAKAPIWALGFGSANLAALTLYSEVTKQERGDCNTQSNARLAEKDTLAIQMQVIVGEATCSNVSPPDPIPSRRFIHPLIDTVSVTVITKDNEVPILRGPDNKVLCEGEFREVLSKQFQCRIETDGTKVGVWQVDAGPGANAVWEFSGTVLLKFDSCPNPTKLLISRLDANAIDFASAELWPTIEITINDNSYQQVESDSSEISLTDFGQIPPKGILRATGKKGKVSDGLPIVTIVPDSCDLGTPPPPTTTAPTPTTIPPPTCEELNNCPPPPPPIWPWIVAAIVLGASFFGYRSYRRTLVFPRGTIVSQQSPVNPKAWIDPAGELGPDIGGRRKVSLSVDRNSNRVSINPDGSACDYIISVSGGQVAIESVAPDEVGGDEESAKKRDKSREIRVEPFGLPIRLEPSVVIRIERPDDTSDDGV